MNQSDLLQHLANLVAARWPLRPTSVQPIKVRENAVYAVNLQDGVSGVTNIMVIQKYANELNMGPEYSTGVTGQSRELARAVNSFALAFLLSFVFMYLILAAQFESFIHPVTILLTLPLSIPFALISTMLSGQRLNIFSALGILLLFGIVRVPGALVVEALA